MVGGRNYADSQFNRAVAAKRQPGSSFKPFVYLAALEKGLTPDTVREDAPISVKGWSPENYSREYFGPVTLTKALSLSLNTVAVRLGLEVGPKAVVAVAHRLGITSDLDAVPSIALGSSDVTPLEMVSAYAAFANGGIGVQPHVIARVRTASGKQLYARRNASFGRVIEPQYVAMMNTMMQETLLTGTARKAEVPGWQAAGKTGTSQEWRDAWFVGYTNYLVAAVWLGNDDGTPTRKVSGGNLPVEIWKPVHEGGLKRSLRSWTWRSANLPRLQCGDAASGISDVWPKAAREPRDRIEPRLNWRAGPAGGDLRATPPTAADGAARRGLLPISLRPQAQAAPFAASATSSIGAFVLSIWGVISLAALIAYNASQLPPIDQLAVPERPPEYRHPRRRWLAHRQSRRHRRPGCQAHRPAAVFAQGVRGHRGPAILRT